MSRALWMGSKGSWLRRRRFVARSKTNCSSIPLRLFQHPMAAVADHDVQYKATVVGSRASGKSQFVSMIRDGSFSEKHAPTIGANYCTRQLKVSNCDVKVQLWDSAGQERFKSMMRAYYRGTHVAFLLYDVTSQDSASATVAKAAEIREMDGEDAVLVLVGNKTDLEDSREVSKEDGQSIADEIGCLFYEMSCKTGEGVMEAFEGAVEEKLAKDKDAESSPVEKSEAEASKSEEPAGEGGAGDGADDEEGIPAMEAEEEEPEEPMLI